MKISPLSVYLWQQIDAFKEGMVCVLIFSIFATIALLVWYFSYNAKEHNVKPPRILLFLVPLLLFFSIGTQVLLPSSKTVAMMYVLPALAESRVVREDIPEIYDMALEATKDGIRGMAKDWKDKLLDKKKDAAK